MRSGSCRFPAQFRELVTRHAPPYLMYPNFLVIGAQKAGTTWLDRNLRTHPQIWLPPEKEIHFFDLPKPLPFAALQYAPNRAVRHWARHRLQRDLAKVDRGEQTEAWYHRYYYAPRSWAWYRSLFTPEAGQVAGEATPRYAVVSRHKIASIHRAMPNLKIVYLLRDPIDRMWSDLAMFHDQRFGGCGTNTVKAVGNDAFLKKSGSLRHSRYAENLSRWQEFFPKDQILTGFLEEISSQPEQLLRRVFAFLEVDPNHPPAGEIASQRINSAKYPPIPENTARDLAKRLADDVRCLHDMLATEQTAAWLRRVESLAILETPPAQT